MIDSSIDCMLDEREKKEFENIEFMGRLQLEED